MLTFVFALLQLVVSLRPGFVELVHGEANVREYEQIPAGKVIRTGPQSHIRLDGDHGIGRPH
jgi:hypothetical protein